MFQYDLQSSEPLRVFHVIVLGVTGRYWELLGVTINTTDDWHEETTKLQNCWLEPRRKTLSSCGAATRRSAWLGSLRPGRSPSSVSTRWKQIHHEATSMRQSLWSGSTRDLRGMKGDLGGIGWLNKSRPVESRSTVTAEECRWHGEGHAHPLCAETWVWSLELQRLHFLSSSTSTWHLLALQLLYLHVFSPATFLLVLCGANVVSTSLITTTRC